MTGPVTALAAGSASFSFEFFPPKPGNPGGEDAFWHGLRQVEALGPSFVSVTYGAGGSSRDRTAQVAGRIVAETALCPVAHLTAVAQSAAELKEVLRSYADAGVRHVLALRGDPPGDPLGAWPERPDGLRYASELIDLVRSCGDFTVGVAAFPERHPASADWHSDIRHFVAKCRAGADYAITQMFFRVEDYLRLRDRLAAAGCDIPVIAEIMPAIAFEQISRFARMSNATIPEDLAGQLARARHDPAASYRIGVAHATELAHRLLDAGAPGLHYITLNRPAAALEIHRAVSRSGSPVAAQ